MTTTAALAETAALFGDPARASMLTALLDGRALTAGSWRTPPELRRKPPASIWRG
jgi:hypothetical protein